jgi:hypothetical protein
MLSETFLTRGSPNSLIAKQATNGRIQWRRARWFLRLFEIASLLVRSDHVASFIVQLDDLRAKHDMMTVAGENSSSLAWQCMAVFLRVGSLSCKRLKFKRRHLSARRQFFAQESE